MHKLKNIVLFMIIMFIGIGCTPKIKTEKELFYEIQTKLNQMESYSVQAEITVYGNKKSQKYLMKQVFEKPDKYRLEIIEPENLSGKITIANGNKAYIHHPKIQQTWIMEEFSNSNEKNMFLGYFMKNCLDSENVKMSKKTLDGEEYLVMRIDIPGNHVYFNKEELWINMSNKDPYLLKVFDGKDELKIEAKYGEFQYNPQLSDGIFRIETK